MLPGVSLAVAGAPVTARTAPLAGGFSAAPHPQGIPGWLLIRDVPTQYLAPMSEADCLHHACQVIRTRVEHHLQHGTPGLCLTSNGEVASKMVLRCGTPPTAIYTCTCAG